LTDARVGEERRQCAQDQARGGRPASRDASLRQAARHCARVTGGENQHREPELARLYEDVPGVHERPDDDLISKSRHPERGAAEDNHPDEHEEDSCQAAASATVDDALSAESWRRTIAATTP